MTDIAEKRLFRRYPIALLVEILSTKEKSVVATGVTRDISLGGIGVITEQELDNSADYLFKLTSSAGKKISSFGKIVWKHYEWKKISYGIQFIKIGFFKKNRFKKFIEKIKGD